MRSGESLMEERLHRVPTDAVREPAWAEARARLDAYLGALGIEGDEAQRLAECALALARAQAPQRPEVVITVLDALLTEERGRERSIPATERGTMQPESVAPRPAGFFVRRLLQPIGTLARRPQPGQ